MKFTQGTLILDSVATSDPVCFYKSRAQINDRVLFEVQAIQGENL